MKRPIPSNDEILEELNIQSHLIYGVAGLGGALGPLLNQFYDERPDHWPKPQTILKAHGLPPTVAGWHEFIKGFGFVVPSYRDVSVAAYRAKEGSPDKPSIKVDEDDDYPELPGYWTETVSYHKLDDLSYLRKVTRVFHPR